MGPENNKVVETHQDSYSLDPKLRVLKSISAMKLRFFNYLNKTENPGENSRFGSCNEFTLGINQVNQQINQNNEFAFEEQCQGT